MERTVETTNQKPVVSVRITPAQKAKLNALVETTGIEPADLLRLVVMRGMIGVEEVVKPSPKANDEITKLLALIGAVQEA